MKSFCLIVLLGAFACNTYCQSIENAFDFWIGDWEVSWQAPNSNVINGENRIDTILGGKVIQENFYDPSTGFKGTSISVYNPQTSRWHQAWADNQGGYYDFVGVVNGEERMFQTPVANAQGMIFRMRFIERKPDSLVWMWEGKKVNAEEWILQWKINYKKKE